MGCSVVVAKHHLNKVVLRNGVVIRAEGWIQHNGKPWKVVHMTRWNGDFQVAVNYPGECSRFFRGDITSVLAILPSSDRDKYAQLFRLLNPTPQKIREIGFAEFAIRSN
jgi:hypothetical protein